MLQEYLTQVFSLSGLQIFFLVPIRSQTQCWKLGWNKGSFRSFPRPSQARPLWADFCTKTKLPEGWGIQKKPPRKLLVHSIIARGFQLFNYTCTGIIFDWTAEDRKSRGAYRPDCAYLRHRKHICAQSKYFQKPKAFFSEDTGDSTEFIWFFVNWKFFSSRKKQVFFKELCCHSVKRELQSRKMNPFILITLWVRFFLPLKYTWTRGRPVWGGCV